MTSSTREQTRVHDADEQQGRRRRVDVVDEVGGVQARQERRGQQEKSSEAGGGAHAPAQSIDASVGQEEPELLQRHPHECEVQEAEALEAGRAAQHIDRDRGQRERPDRPVRRAFVRGREKGKQRLAEEEDPQEPQRLAVAEARRRDQIGRDARDREHGERDADDRDREDRGSQQAVQSAGDEVHAGSAALPQTPVGEETGEAADDEEQRHDLEEPAERGDPARAVAGVVEHGAGRVDRDADHDGVQEHDAEHAQRPDEVDPGVAGCARGSRDGDGARCLDDGHESSSGVVSQETMDAVASGASPSGAVATPYDGVSQEDGSTSPVS